MRIKNDKGDSLQTSAIEIYKSQILALVNKSNDVNYLMAVYSFADSYPDRSGKDFG